MDIYLLDWASLLLRWLHVITAMAWVGAAFFFAYADAILAPRAIGAAGVQEGDSLRAVHSGFHRPVELALRWPRQSARLHWFYWESYATWLSGFALLVLTYLWDARANLIDAARMDWSPGAAVGVALGFLLVFWLLYDAICRTLGERQGCERLADALVALLVVLTAWLACRWFAGRAAFLLVGATLGTAMSANVAHWIIAGQRRVIAALEAGEPADPVRVRRAQQRLCHNTYFTLPVLFAMLSTHYALTWNHPHNWVALVLMMASGVSIRHAFVLRHGRQHGRSQRSPWPYALAAVALVIATMVWLAP